MRTNHKRTPTGTDEDNIDLTLEGNGTPQFFKGRINKQLFVMMIDSGSPITIFTKDVRKLLKIDVTFVRPLHKMRSLWIITVYQRLF